MDETMQGIIQNPWELIRLIFSRTESNYTGLLIPGIYRHLPKHHKKYLYKAN